MSKSNTSKTVIFIVAQDGFRDEEYFESQKVISEAGFKTLVASQEKGMCKGKLGGEVSADISISEIVLDDSLVAVLVIGGPGSPKLMEVKELGTVLRNVREEKKLLGAICYAPAVVASFDVIDGLSATCYLDDFSKPILKEHNVLYIDGLVVVDELLVTGNGPAAATAFGEQIVEILTSDE